jgi:hypothetical protein
LPIQAILGYIGVVVGGLAAFQEKFAEKLRKRPFKQELANFSGKEGPAQKETCPDAIRPGQVCTPSILGICCRDFLGIVGLIPLLLEFDTQFVNRPVPTVG